jgi:hypothetical protein
MIRKSMVLMATLIAVALASASNAATLTLVADQPVYQVGDTITLTSTADTEGASGLLAFGRLLFSNPSIANIASGTPNQTAMLAFGSIPWITGPLLCTSSSCEMMNQISPITATPSNSTIPLVSTVSFMAVAAGTSQVTWDTDNTGGFQLDFFGLTNGPSTTIVVEGQGVVPEPTTAALLSIGLLGLAITGRRRS